MKNWARLERVKIGGRYIYNLRCINDTVLLTESSNDLKTTSDEIERSVKVGLHLNIRTKIMTIEYSILKKKTEIVKDFAYPGSMNNLNDCSQEIKRMLRLGRQQ